MSGDVTNDELIGILADGQLCGPDRCSSRVPNACTCALAAARMKEALGKLDEYEHREKLHMDRCRHDMERIVRLEQQLADITGKHDIACFTITDLQKERERLREQLDELQRYATEPRLLRWLRPQHGRTRRVARG